MHRYVRYLVYGSALGLGIFIGCELPLTTSTEADYLFQTVNRVPKGDRLRLPQIRAANPNAVDTAKENNLPREPLFDFKLPEGCEPLVSPMAQSPWRNIASRCLS
jgi:hypothetical protein